MIEKLFGRGTYIAPRPLGKYIILYASVMHYVWAILLMFDRSAGESTPVAAMINSLHGRWPTIIALLVVSTMAVLFIWFRTLGLISGVVYGILLFPQLWLLLLSAGGGIMAIANGYYADGVIRGWPFIATDQSAIIVLLFLYATAIVEIGHNKFSRLPLER